MKLPSSTDLSEEQNEIYWQPLDSRMLVTGPPGTGKTVMALYRGQMVAKAGGISKIRIIVFNKVLRKYSTEGLADGEFEMGAELSKCIKTMHQWVYHWWKTSFRQAPPTMPQHKYIYDWDQMVETLTGSSDSNMQHLAKWDHLIIDEGQDFDQGLYNLIRYLVKLITRIKGAAPGFTIMADENQRITPSNSCIREIREPLKKLDGFLERSLRKNYRNSVQIAAWAAKFYCDVQTGIPDPPKKTGEADPRLDSYRDIGEEVERIVGFASVRANLSIGVIVDREATRKKIFDLLCEKMGERKSIGAKVSKTKKSGPKKSSAGAETVLARQILDALAGGGWMKAREIAKKIKVDKSHVNRVLFSQLTEQGMVQKSSTHMWKATGGAIGNKGSSIDNIISEGAAPPQPLSVNGRVQTYSSKEKTDEKTLSLDKSGLVTVLCHASCKGLEFDAVFLPQLQNASLDPNDLDVFKMGMYVKISRARDFLFMSYTSSSGAVPEIVKLLSQD